MKRSARGCMIGALIVLSLILIGEHHVIAQITQRETLYVDDSDGAPFYTETGSLWQSSAGFGWNGSHRYVQLDDPQNIDQTARWTPDIVTQGYYHTSFYLPPTSNSRNHALYIVSPSGASIDSSWHDQSDNSGNFISLGIFQIDSGMGNFVEVINDSTSTAGYIFRADATRYILGPDEQDFEPGRRNVYNFGEVVLLNHKDWVLRVYNIGGENLTIDEVSFGTASYSLFDPTQPIIISAREHADLTVRFMPYAEQTFDDVMTIHSDDPDEPTFGLSLTGQGIGQFVLVNNDDGTPGYIEEVGEWLNSYGTANCPGVSNTTSRYAIQSTNPGATATFTPDIPIEGFYRIYYAGPVTASASDHALCVIRPWGTAPDSVWFDQNTDLACDWKLMGIYYLVAGTDNTVSLINDGTGAGYVLRADLMKFVNVPDFPVIYLPINHHIFEDVPVSEAEEWSFSIHNVGSAEMTIYNIVSTNTEAFTLTWPPSFPVSVPGYDSISATVEFHPATVDSFEGTLWIASDAANYDTIGVFLNGNSVVEDTTAPQPINDLRAQLHSGMKSYWGNIYLTWSEPFDSVGVNHYIIYRSNEPYELGDSIATVADTFFLDEQVIGHPYINFYYIIKSVDWVGNKSDVSNQVGEFDKLLRW